LYVHYAHISVQYILLLLILVPNQITYVLGQEIGKIALGRIKYKFRASSNKDSSLNPEDGTDRLSRNVGKTLPLLAR
jgi:hypothetical protein